VYADAYFLMGDLRFKPSSFDIPGQWSAKECKLYENGWGLVAFLAEGRQAVTMRRAVPPDVIQLFCTRKAYIYFLETWGQIVVSFALAEWLDGPYLSFVDNKASEFALLKGYGEDACINNFAGTFCLERAEHSSFPWFERVSSKEKISDAISKGDFKEAQEEGLLHLDIDYSETYDFLRRFASDELYAHDQEPRVSE
jgi:hypothetical protein